MREPMKVQMQGQRVRLRVDEAELARLQAGEGLENLTRFPGGTVSRQQLRVVPGVTALWTAVEAGWQCGMPIGLLDAYVAQLPCRDALPLHLSLADGSALEIGFEVDVRDSVRNRGSRRGG